MKNTKENILKVLKAKRDTYWESFQTAENGKDKEFWSSKWFELEKIIELFENESAFNEAAKIWLKEDK